MDTDFREPNSDWLGKQPSRLRVAATWAACRAASALQIIRGNRCADGFAIVMYHRVSEVFSGVESPTMNVTPDQLRRQLTGLLNRGFECWPLTRLIDAHREKTAVPSNVFAITFDDGFENNYLHAWPILRELNLPATIFLATKYLDSDRPFPFDDWCAAGSSRVHNSSWRPLSRRQCEEMLATGMIDFGAHTHCHEKFLGRCSEFRRDMRLCLETLRDYFGIERPTFAFPYGTKSPELVDAAKQLGVVCSLSTRARRVSPVEDPFEWGRIWADSNDSPAMLAAKLCWYPTVVNVGQPLVAALARLEQAINRRAGNHLSTMPASELPRATTQSASR